MAAVGSGDRGQPVGADATPDHPNPAAGAGHGLAFFAVSGPPAGVAGRRVLYPLPTATTATSNPRPAVSLPNGGGDRCQAAPTPQYGPAAAGPHPRPARYPVGERQRNRPFFSPVPSPRGRAPARRVLPRPAAGGWPLRTWSGGRLFPLAGGGPVWPSAGHHGLGTAPMPTHFLSVWPAGGGAGAGWRGTCEEDHGAHCSCAWPKLALPFGGLDPRGGAALPATCEKYPGARSRRAPASFDRGVGPPRGRWTGGAAPADAADGADRVSAPPRGSGWGSGFHHAGLRRGGWWRYRLGSR
jgi:hypothetical protein